MIWYALFKAKFHKVMPGINGRNPADRQHSVLKIERE